MVKAVKSCIMDSIVGRMMCESLKASLREPSFPHKIQNGIAIIYVSKDASESFIECVIAALSLIEKTNPRLRRVLRRNIEYIIGDRPLKDKWLAKFHRHLNGCQVNWNQVDAYSPRMKERIMAAALVHEAYHGECYRIYGNTAYAKAPFEKICRNREIRILKHFISTTTVPDSRELLARIAVLEK